MVAGAAAALLLLDALLEDPPPPDPATTTTTATAAVAATSPASDPVNSRRRPVPRAAGAGRANRRFNPFVETRSERVTGPGALSAQDERQLGELGVLRVNGLPGKRGVHRHQRGRDLR